MMRRHRAAAGTVAAALLGTMLPHAGAQIVVNHGGGTVTAKDALRDGDVAPLPRPAPCQPAIGDAVVIAGQSQPIGAMVRVLVVAGHCKGLGGWMSIDSIKPIEAVRPQLNEQATAPAAASGLNALTGQR